MMSQSNHRRVHRNDGRPEHKPKAEQLLSGTALGLILLFTAPHFAAAQNVATAGDSLAEVVVTAEKREESAQKTPISMEVYSSHEIDQKGIVDMKSLAATDTSLNYNPGAGEGYLTLRGVSSADTTEIGSPSVPVVVDNFSSNRSWSLQTSLFDLDRIEVLRGPQGTLYGHSATGGLINVIPNKPTTDFAASSNVEYGNYNTLNVTGVLNVPVSDNVQFRVAAATRNHDGYHGDVVDILGVPSEKGDDEDSRAVRIQLAFQPTDNFHARLSYDYLHIGGMGAATQSIPFNYLPVNGAPCTYLQACAGTDNISHNKPALGNSSSFPIYGEIWQDITEKTGKWEFTYQGLPGGAQISYLGGFGLLEWHHLDSGETNFASIYGTSENGFFPTREFQQNEEPHTQNQELRLTSADNGPFTWQAGLYYFQEKNNLISQDLLNPGASGAKALFTFIFPEVDQISRAVYAQGSYALTDTSKITAGVRYNEDSLLRTGIFNLTLFGFNGIPEYGSARSNKTTWHVGYDWQATPVNLVYAKVDTGYKPGGFTTCGEYNPETVTTGEIGSKNRFSDQRIQWNTAVFYSDYKDQQVSQFTASCVSGTSVTNAGESRIYGLETQLTALVDPLGKLDFSLSYLHARYVKFLVPPTIGPAALVDCAHTVATPAGTNCDLSGNTLTQAPNWTISAAFEHAWNAFDGGKINLRLEGKYTSKQYFDSFNFSDTEQGAYAIGNAYLDYGHDNWLFGLYARNFTNTTYLTFGAEATGGGDAEYEYAYGAPRTFGVRFQVGLKQH
jgi:iron complex outermembrane receptor protein